MEISEINKTTKKDIYQIDPRTIVVVDGFNSRVNFDLDNLKEQIREHGVLNPISVIPFKDESGYESYKLVDGERRYRATMALIAEGIDIKRIPALFLPRCMTEVEKLTQQIIRNEGKPFTEYEMAIACEKYIKYGYTQADIARTLGKDKRLISNYMQHLQRDPRVQELMKTGIIDGQKVREIYRAHDNEEDAVSEIINASDSARKSGASKVSIKEIDPSSRTIAVKETAEIRKGLTKLFILIDRYTNGGKDPLGISMMEIYKAIKNDSRVTVAEILEKKREEKYGKAV